MKKLLSLICVMGCLLSLCACAGKKSDAEGINEREMASFSPVLNCGDKTYIKYSGAEKDEYIEIGEDTFTLVRDDTEGMKFSVKKSKSEAAVYLKAIEGQDTEVKTSSEYREFSEKLQKKLKKFKNYECLVVKIGDSLYGAVNCYTRASGEDGDKFMSENFEKSYLITYEKNRVRLSKKIEDMAILAVNATHYIGYSDLTFYSVNLKTEEKTELFKDRWHSSEEGHKNSTITYFTDEIFLINGVVYEGDNCFESTIVCKIDGSSVRMLVNNKKV